MDQSFLTENLSKENLYELSGKLRQLKSLRKEIDLLESKLKNVKKLEEKLSCEEIPGFLYQYGIQGLTLDNGAQLKIKESIYVSLPKNDLAKRGRFLDWLKENGGEYLIKETLTINEPQEKVVKELSDSNIPFVLKDDVNTNSLKAFFNDVLGMKKGSQCRLELTDIPEEFNLFIKKETTIKE